MSSLPGSVSVHVNFSRPMPLFPLHTATLLPHGLIQLHVFEPRYRQMVSDVLDNTGQIAMAVFDGDRWKREYHGRPPLKPAVCIGQIVKHIQNDDAHVPIDPAMIAGGAPHLAGIPGKPLGTYDIVLQGICRGTIVSELPSDDTHMYRRAMLEPLGDAMVDDSILDDHRDRLVEMLSAEPLSDLRNADGFVEHLRVARVPANVIFELLAYSFLSMDDERRRYEYLAEGDPLNRAAMVEATLEGLSDLLRRASPQRKVLLRDRQAGPDGESDPKLPKGCTWN